MRRLSALLALLLSLVLCDFALAQAGGGSGGFGGGGGGGGGGFGGGSRGSGSSGDETVGSILVIVIVVVAVLVVAGLAILGWYTMRKRTAAVRTASAEAAQDDAYFAADRVEKEAGELFLMTQHAWHERNRDHLAQLVGPDLMVEWTRRLDDFDSRGWHNVVQVRFPPRVQYVGLVNRDDDTQDRVTVHIEGEMTSYVQDAQGTKILKDGATSEQVKIEEYWTLARYGERWICVSIEQASEGGHHLSSEIIATPDADVEGIRGQAVNELAVADAVPEGFTTADLAVVDFKGTARQEALDLSLADGRFAPDVLEVAARRAVGAWAEAVDGDDAALAAVATPEALQRLLYGTDASGATRLVVRGPRVRRIGIEWLDARTRPARMSLSVEVAAVRYVENRDTTDVVSGSKSGASTFSERWTMALDGPDDSPWRLVAVA